MHIDQRCAESTIGGKGQKSLPEYASSIGTPAQRWVTNAPDLWAAQGFCRIILSAAKSLS